MKFHEISSLLSGFHEIHRPYRAVTSVSYLPIPISCEKEHRGARRPAAVHIHHTRGERSSFFSLGRCVFPCKPLLKHLLLLCMSTCRTFTACMLPDTRHGALQLALLLRHACILPPSSYLTFFALLWYHSHHRSRSSSAGSSRP